MKRQIIYSYLPVFVFLLIFSSIQAAETGSLRQFRYKTEIALGPLISTNTYGIGFNIAKFRSADNLSLVNFNILNYKHYKEARLTNGFENASPFIYGKINNLYSVKIMTGFQNTLGDREDASSIKISYNYRIGGSAGFLKPVYIGLVKYKPDNDLNYEVQEVRYDPEIHHRDSVHHTSGFKTGIEKTMVIPGISAATGLVFEWGKNFNRFNQLEIGVAVDYFPTQVPFFAYIEKEKLFANLYLHYSLGKRW
jgi:hypothetical protein